MKVLIYLVFFLFSYGVFAKECPNSMKKTLKKNRIRTVECQIVKNSILEEKIKHIIVIRDEGTAGRGIGVEIYSSKDLKKPIFQDFGLGQVLGNFQLNEKRSKILVKDIDNDGTNEIGFNVLNERSALFFIYQYNAKIKSYKTINFKRNFKGNLQTMDHLVSALDWPVEVLTDEIKVWYEKEKFITYKLKDGEYFSDID